MPPGEAEVSQMEVRETEVGPVREGYQPVRLVTSRGEVWCRSYPVPGARLAAIWVGGVGGDWDTPARGLYPRLSSDLRGAGITSLRLRYRHPAMLEESVLDVLAGLGYLESEGIESTALIGHSFGGAVVIQAAAHSETVRAVVTLATQSYGAAPVSTLGPKRSILLLHGQEDRVLSHSSSDYVYRLAREPKRLILYPGAGHDLDEVAEDVYRAVRDWVVERLRGAVPQGRPWIERG